MRTHQPLPPDNSVLILNIVVLSINFAVLPHVQNFHLLMISIKHLFINRKKKLKTQRFQFFYSRIAKVSFHNDKDIFIRYRTKKKYNSMRILSCYHYLLLNQNQCLKHKQISNAISDL